jgi:pyruvate dehydrogenase E2 component (dihydrolipoamide acetyltransferase)
MATVINMPRLSDTMTEGTVANWLKNVGDVVKEGDILAEIETDKATMEFESFNAGTLLYIGIAAGETAAVDSLLAIIGKEGEDISGLISGTSNPEVKEQVTISSSIDNSQPTATLPKGVIIVTMPRLSDTMTDGTVASWLKNVGDIIKEGDILAEIETDKATMEFESFNAGTLLYIGVNAGETAPVDSLLAIIGPIGTDVSSIVANGGKIIKEEQESTNQNKIDVQPSIINHQPSNNERIFISPLAKKIADERGINPLQIKGTGENGRIIKSDVENYKVEIQNTKVENTAFVPTINHQPIVSSPVSERIPNSTMRKIIAKRLSESIFTAPHFYLTIEINMDEAMKSRVTINNLPDTKVSFNDLVIKACAMGLKKHLKVNSQWNDDAITINHHINIGVAVAVEDGLVVPVLKNTDFLSLTQIGSSVRDLAGRAKLRKLAPNEMDGSTFTVSNLGMFGITEFTSIINQPNSAILSVGAIVEKPVVKNGQIVVGNTMKVTLACDHRTVDGATGAAFLQTLKLYLENPVTMLA